MGFTTCLSDDLAGTLASCDIGTCNTSLSTCNGNLGTCSTNLGTCTTGLGTCNAGAAVAGDVLVGKRFSSRAGLGIMGTAPAGSNVTGANGSLVMTIPDGHYTGSKTCTAMDGNLVAGNIRSGASIFGVSGNPNVVNTSSGDAVAGEV